MRDDTTNAQDEADRVVYSTPHLLDDSFKHFFLPTSNLSIHGERKLGETEKKWHQRYLGRDKAVSLSHQHLPPPHKGLRPM